MLLLDGAYTFDDEAPRFHRVAAPSPKPNSSACSTPSNAPRSMTAGRSCIDSNTLPGRDDSCSARPHRLHPASSPTSPVLSADSDFSPPSRVASSPSLGATTVPPLLRTPERDDSPKPGPLLSRHPRRLSNGGEDETSQVPGRPLPACPALRPRRTAVPSPLQNRRWGLPPKKQRRLRTNESFGAPSRGLQTPCVRFAAGVAPGPRDTPFRRVASLVRSGLSPAGSHRGFPACSSLYMTFPPHLALPGAILPIL